MENTIYDLHQKIHFASPNLRHLFDAFSDEYGRVTIETKIDDLAKIIYFGDLASVVKEYKSNRTEQYKKAVKSTLLGCISYLQTGKISDFSYLSKFKSFSEAKIIKYLNELLLAKINSEYSVDKLIYSFLQKKFEYDDVEYEKQKKFFSVDFEKDIHKQLRKRTQEENLEIGFGTYSDLFTYLDCTLFHSLYSNEFIYLNVENLDGGFTEIMRFITNTYLPKSIQNQFKNNSEFRREKLLELTKAVVEILYFNKPLFDFDVWFIRNNFGDDSFSKIRSQLFEENQIGILVDQKYEIEDWKRLENGEKMLSSKSSFIRAWFTLQQKVKERNVIVVSSYLNQSQFKIGLITKGSNYFELKNNPDVKIFQLDNIINVEKKDTPIFNALIPQQSTLSPIHKRKNYVISKYLKTKLSISLDNLSESAIELMCAEWLRSDFVERKFKIKSQLLKIGGSNAISDIYGLSESGEKIVAQVSFTKDFKQINKKIINLLKFKANRFLMFCNADSITDEKVEVISLHKVFEDFVSDSFYEKFIEELISN